MGQEAVLDAVPGLGEALVSGRVNPDHFVVDRANRFIKERRFGEKQIAVQALPGGVTEVVGAAGSSSTACVSDEEVLRIVQLGERVEAHYQAPQDIEWALDQGRRLWLLQARPITTLFPIPHSSPGDGLHVYLNMSNLQGVLQPLTPMGIDIFRRIGTGAAALLGFDVDPERGPAPLQSSPADCSSTSPRCCEPRLDAGLPFRFWASWSPAQPTPSARSWQTLGWAPSVPCRAGLWPATSWN